MLTKTLIACALMACLWTAGSTRAADVSAAATPGGQGEAGGASTLNKDRLPPPQEKPPGEIGKVKVACALLETEGPAALPKPGGKNSPVLYEGMSGFTPWPKPTCWCLRFNTGGWVPG